MDGASSHRAGRQEPGEAGGENVQALVMHAYGNYIYNVTI